MSEMITQEQPTTIALRSEERPRTALTDLRQAMMNLSPETMELALHEYDDRRITFRRWLLESLNQGVHYGFPPGCKAKSNDELSWKSKPSLYKAGAEFICDLMGWRPVYAADKDAWEMMGAVPGKLVIRCTLVSRSSGEIIGEGMGARKVGEKSMDENASLKMAQKNALVCAVLNAQGLSDLFSQDLEDLPQRENPVPTNTPQAPTRAQRQDAPPKVDPGKNCKTVYAAFAKKHPGKSGKELTPMFREWLFKHLGKKFDERADENWGEWDVPSCLEALA